MSFDDDTSDFTVIYPGDMPDSSPISPPIDYLAQLAGLVDSHYALNPILPQQQKPWDSEHALAMADTPEYAPRSLLGTVQKLSLDKDDGADPLQAYRYSPYAALGAFADFLGGQNTYGQSSPSSNHVDVRARQPNQAMFADEPAFAYAYAANQKARQEPARSLAPGNPDQILSGDTIMDRPVEYMGDKALQLSLLAGNDWVKQAAAREIARRKQADAPSTAIAEQENVASIEARDTNAGNNDVEKALPDTSSTLSASAPLRDSEPEYIKAYASGWQPSGTSARPGDGWIRLGKRLDVDPAALAVANANDGSLDLQPSDYISPDGTKTVSDTSKAVVRQIWQDQASFARQNSQDQQSNTANKPLRDKIGKQYAYLSEGPASLKAGEGSVAAHSQTAQAARDLYGAEVTRLVQHQPLSAQDAQIIQVWEHALNDKMRASQISSLGSDDGRRVYVGGNPISNTASRGLENRGMGQYYAPPGYTPYPAEPGLTPVITPATLLPASRIPTLIRLAIKAYKDAALERQVHERLMEQLRAADDETDIFKRGDMRVNSIAQALHDSGASPQEINDFFTNAIYTGMRGKGKVPR